MKMYIIQFNGIYGKIIKFKKHVFEKNENVISISIMIDFNIYLKNNYHCKS